MWYWLANGLETLLTLFLIVSGISVTYLAIEVVRNAYSDTHPKS